MTFLSSIGEADRPHHVQWNYMVEIRGIVADGCGTDRKCKAEVMPYNMPYIMRVCLETRSPDGVWVQPLSAL